MDRRTRRSGGRWAGAVAGLAVVAALAYAAPAVGQVGIAAGWNVDFPVGVKGSGGAVEAEDGSGWNMGIFYNWNASAFGFRPGIYYHRVTDLLLYAGGDSTSVDLDIVEFPLEARARLRISILTPYLVVAPVIGFPSTSLQSVDETLSGTAWKLDLVLGVEIWLGIRLWPEVRFGIGLNDLANQDRPIPIGESATGNFKLNSLSFRLGVSF